jgi:hypothetical protein
MTKDKPNRDVPSIRDATDPDFPPIRHAHPPSDRTQAAGVDATPTTRESPLDVTDPSGPPDATLTERAAEHDVMTDEEPHAAPDASAISDERAARLLGGLRWNRPERPVALATSAGAPAAVHYTQHTPAPAEPTPEPMPAIVVPRSAEPTIPPARPVREEAPPPSVRPVENGTDLPVLPRSNRRVVVVLASVLGAALITGIVIAAVAFTSGISTSSPAASGTHAPKPSATSTDTTPLPTPSPSLSALPPPSSAPPLASSTAIAPPPPTRATTPRVAPPPVAPPKSNTAPSAHTAPPPKPPVVDDDFPRRP